MVIKNVIMRRTVAAKTSARLKRITANWHVYRLAGRNHSKRVIPYASTKKRDSKKALMKFTLPFSFQGFSLDSCDSPTISRPLVGRHVTSASYFVAATQKSAQWIWQNTIEFFVLKRSTRLKNWENGEKGCLLHWEFKLQDYNTITIHARR